MTDSIHEAARDQVISRLRAERDAGRLDETTFHTRVSEALTTDSPDTLQRQIELPSVQPTFEVYPHQSVAPVRPIVGPDDPDPVPDEFRTPYESSPHGPLRRPAMTNLGWVLPVVSVILVAALVFGVSHGLWWLIFLIPGLIGRRAAAMRYQHEQWRREQWQGNYRRHNPHYRG